MRKGLIQTLKSNSTSTSYIKLRLHALERGYDNDLRIKIYLEKSSKGSAQNLSVSQIPSIFREELKKLQNKSIVSILLEKQRADGVLQFGRKKVILLLKKKFLKKAKVALNPILSIHTPEKLSSICSQLFIFKRKIYAKENKKSFLTRKTCIYFLKGGFTRRSLYHVRFEKNLTSNNFSERNEIFQKKDSQDQKKTIDIVAKSLKAKNTKDFLIRSLGKMGPDAIPVLIELLANKSDRVKILAAEVLGNMGSKASLAVSALIQRFQSKNKNLKKTILVAFGKIGRDAKPAVPILVQALQNKILRDLAIIALKKIGEKKVLPHLIQLYRQVRKESPSIMQFKTLHKLTQTVGKMIISSEKVSDLMQGLKHKNYIVRRFAVDRLRRKNIQPKIAIPVFLQALHDKDHHVSWVAMDVLGRIGKKRAVFALIPFLCEQRAMLRGKAASSLGKIGKNSKPAIPTLLKLIHDKHKYVRKAAIRALIEIDPKDPNVLSHILDFTKLTHDEDEYVRREAVNALGKIAPKHPRVIQVLIQALYDKNRAVSYLAGKLLQKIKPVSALDALIKALEDKRLHVRRSVIYILQKLGPKALKAVPALILRLEDREGFIRSRAVDTLGKIGAKAVFFLIPALGPIAILLFYNLSNLLQR